MNKDLKQQAIHMRQEKKHRKGWQTLVRMLVLCVVFCTTYAMILPAITLEQNSCGLTEHTHTDACYMQIGRAHV